MATPRCDHSIPQYAQAVAVDTSAPWVGRPIALNGCLAISLQVISTNGAAGSIYIDGTNQDVAPLSWVTPSTVAVSASQQQVISFSLEDNVTSMHQMRVRFAATAAGNITIAINLRHTTR